MVSQRNLDIDIYIFLRYSRFEIMKSPLLYVVKLYSSIIV